MRDLADLHDHLRKSFGQKSWTDGETSAPSDAPPALSALDAPSVPNAPSPRGNAASAQTVLSSLLARIGAFSRFAPLGQETEPLAGERTVRERDVKERDVEERSGGAHDDDGALVSVNPQHVLDSLDLIALPAILRQSDGRIRGANAAFRSLIGTRRVEGQTPETLSSDTLSPETLSPETLSLEMLGLSPPPAPAQQSCDVEYVSPEGYRILLWQDVMVRDAQSGDRLILSQIRDVTAERGTARTREEARIQAEEASAAKSRQLATVVHELRTPLNGILGMSQLLNQTALTLEQKNYIGGIRQAGSALAQLVDDLLDYATIEAGRFRLNSRAENLRQLLESVVEMLAPRAHEKGIEIGATVAHDVPGLMDFDSGRLRQVLFNVIGNAVKFTTSGGVLIRVSLDSPDIVITVADTGPGLSKDEQARLFQDFEQTGSAMERSGGTGLGLSISARILTELGGALSLVSEKGRGTTFSIRFPASPVEGGKEGSDRMLWLRSSRVLLVAPAGPVATTTLSTIETLGGRGRHARSIAEANHLIEQSDRQGMRFTDLVVDQRVTDPAEFTAAADALRRILLVSPEERNAQAADTYDAWLIRPIREQSLVDVLRGHLGGSSLRARARHVLPSAAETGERRDLGLSVLLAEDDPVSAMMVGAILRKAGCTVQPVHDLASLRAVLSGAHSLDLVISDIHLPDGTVEEILPLLAGQTGAGPLPLLVMSGETNPEVKQKILAKGARRVLQKPVDPQHLLDEMRLVLAGLDRRHAS